jgi:hypothetical protein
MRITISLSGTALPAGRRAGYALAGNAPVILGRGCRGSLTPISPLPPASCSHESLDYNRPACSPGSQTSSRAPRLPPQPPRLRVESHSLDLLRTYSRRNQIPLVYERRQLARVLRTLTGQEARPTNLSPWRNSRRARQWSVSPRTSATNPVWTEACPSLPPTPADPLRAAARLHTEPSAR